MGILNEPDKTYSFCLSPFDGRGLSALFPNGSQGGNSTAYYLESLRWVREGVSMPLKVTKGNV